MTNEADKAILDLLAALEFEADYNSDNADDQDIDPDVVAQSARRATTLKRLIREAGYTMPEHFDWMRHFGEPYNG
jgi:hypothetical protein